MKHFKIVDRPYNSEANYAMARLDGKYDELREKGERIYNNYFTDANRYIHL